MWDARTGTSELDLKGHTAGCEARCSARTARGSSPAVRRDGEGVGRADGHAPARTEGPHGPGAVARAFSPDGTRIVTASDDETAKVWDARTARALLELKGHTRRVRSVAFSPDGTRIVTGSSDETARCGTRGRARAARTQRAHELGHERVVQPGRHADRHRRVDEDEAKVWDARTGCVCSN